MKTELVELSPTERQITVEIGPETIREVYNKISQKYAKTATVPGFRRGFAPLDIVRLRFREEIKNDVIRELLPGHVSKAIEETGLMPLTEPHLHFEDWDNLKLNGSQPLKVEVHFEVMPEIPEPEYKGLEVVRRVRPVTEEEIEELIEKRLEEFASLIPVEGRKAEEGDTIIADLEGKFADDEKADPIVVNDLEITLGDKTIDKTFTENLIGVEEDDEKEFTVSYPADFSTPSLAGKTVNYKAKIKSVGKIEIPEPDDEWAQSLDEGYESLADLKEKLTGDLKTIAKDEADFRVRNELIQKLIDKYDFAVPKVLIENQARSLLNNFARDLAQRGYDLRNVEEEFVKAAYEQMRRQAEVDVRGAIILEKIIELENINVGQSEIDEEIEKIASHYGVKAEEIKKQEGLENSIANTLRTRKAVEAVYQNAKITDGEWIDESTPQPENISYENADNKAAENSKDRVGEVKEKPKKKSARKK
jgi:trigger factor